MSSPAVRPLTLTTLLVAATLACSAVPAAAASSEQEPTPAPTSTPTSRPAATPSSTPSSAASASDRQRGEIEEGGESTGETPQSSDRSDDAPEVGDSGAWLSGASGEGAADGALGQWRGDDVDIVGTWADQGDNQTELYSIAPGGDVADFDGAIDIAPGGLQEGESWAAAADGAYEDRWRESLTRMAELREGRGTTYVRPFHEFNLSGWDWSVSPGDAEDFKAAWERYRAIQQEVFPEARLVYGVNVTSSGTDLDWRTTWPGEGQVDVLGVDTYNGWPTITSEAEFDAQLDARGEDGIPVGLQAYSEQAEQWGVPLAVPEWSGRAEMGDEPTYVEGMVDWFAENAGDGPGQLEYEVLFNAPQDDGNFQLYSDDSRMPESAQAYVEATEETAEQRVDALQELEGGSLRTSATPGERPTSITNPSTSTESTDPFNPLTPKPTTSPDAREEDVDGTAKASAGPVTREEFNRLAQRLDELLNRLTQDA